ncbi:MAG: hypothetical protein Q7S22_00935 [Candidatus Micrarchaeota archaeon]|nr:hypothetical protein [Candidatus Micrarchaeota archaeon]
MKSSFTILIIFLLIFGCTSGNKNISDVTQNDTTVVTQKDIYQFNYSKYWVPFSETEKSLVMLLGSGEKFDRLLSTRDEETVIVFISDEGLADCRLVTKELMGYAELNNRNEAVNNRGWCILEGYETTPSEYSFDAMTNCGNGHFITIGMIGPEKNKVKDKEEFYKILESFKCLN